MKYRFCALFLFVLMVSSALRAQPRLNTESQFSFGKIFKGSRASHILKVTNTGTDTLSISDVSAQCGCTAAMVTKKRLAPQETGDLSITFNTAAYNGPVTKHVYLTSNDPRTPRMTIEFTATVIQSISPDPNYVSFNVTKTDSVYSKVITLTNMTQQALKILSVSTEMEGLKLSVLKTQLMPNEQTELQVALQLSTNAKFRSSAANPPPTTQGLIAIKTDDPNQPEVDVQVFEWSRHP